jgi:hypothetical protein
MVKSLGWKFTCTSRFWLLIITHMKKAYQWFYWTSNPQFWEKSQSVHGAQKQSCSALQNFIWSPWWKALKDRRREQWLVLLFLELWTTWWQFLLTTTLDQQYHHTVNKLNNFLWTLTFFKNSFVSRTTKDWNSISEDVVNCETVESLNIENSHDHHISPGPSWSWSYSNWISKYLCNQCLSLLTLWVRIPLRRGVLDTTLYEQVCQCLAAGRRFSPSIHGLLHQ